VSALIAAAAILLAFAATYTVREYEKVIVTRFGEIRGDAIEDPGLHYKLPFVDRVHRFDRRWIEWDGDPNEIPTGDKKYIWVDTFGRWRIADPVLFYKRLRDRAGAQSRLDDIIDGEIRNVIANHDLIEVVRTSSRTFETGGETDLQRKAVAHQVKYGRDKLRALVLEKASAVVPDYGIELADVQIKRINYVESVQKKVFERMISERQRIAERYRSEGVGKSAEIRGEVERDLKEIQSAAYREAVEIRGKADAEATTIYADAYNADPEFYRFMKTLETYERTIDEDTLIVLGTDAELLQFLKTDGSP
jgi:membrane protease subunit HflC